uniref:Retroviral polymerase SH3-like domain-containing protein n=1 Tax=Phytophthora ramorum TaxID=164328 RepID=H3G5D3_PHYRM
MERVRALLLDGNLPKPLWAECVRHVTTLINMTPSSKTNGKTPYELWYNRKPSMEFLKVFGCSAYVHITEQYRDKLDARARLCMYLGLPDHKKGYRL